MSVCTDRISYIFLGFFQVCSSSAPLKGQPNGTGQFQGGSPPRNCSQSAVVYGWAEFEPATAALQSGTHVLHL
jgi:hypothetical protein